MDKQTKQYREGQFDRLTAAFYEFKPKIKIIKPNGETSWIDIEESELAQIISLLTK